MVFDGTNGPGTPGQPRLTYEPDNIDASYAYFGWCMDDLKRHVPSSTGSLALLSALLVQSGQTIPPALSAQLAAVLAGFFNNAGGLAYNVSTLPPAADKDIDVTSLGLNGFGNGGGNTIYRLREGIERFLITDINNPGAANMAQSTLWIMMDVMSAGASGNLFNHIPGGCNVLFMDGHVEFIRYVAAPGIESMDATAADVAVQGATQPVIPSVAVMIGAMAS